MKKQIFTLFLAVIFGASLFAAKTPLTILKTKTAPVLDGTVDALWNADTITAQTFKAHGTETPSVDGSTWKAVWCDSGIFILIQVLDDVFYPIYADGNTAAGYMVDKCEIYFDANYVTSDDDLIDGKGPAAANSGHYQFAPDLKLTMQAGDVAEKNANGSWWAFKLTGANVDYEHFIPFTSLKNAAGGSIKQTGSIGFDVCISDNDNDTRKRADWVNDLSGTAATESWSNMDDCGIIVLKGAVETITADDMTISAPSAVITTDNGTLQFTANITPAEATEKNIKWGIINGTGKATIDDKGLVTGKLDGTVTVEGTTVDGSEIYVSTDITISGQCVTLDDISLIANFSYNSTFVGDDTKDQWVSMTTIGNVQMENNTSYVFTLIAKAATEQTRFAIDFEDAANGYNRFGDTNDANAVANPSNEAGYTNKSEWRDTVLVADEWQRFTQNVYFGTIAENCGRAMNFFFGNSISAVSLDSMYMYKTADLALLNPNPAECEGLQPGVHSVNASSVSVYPNPVVNELTVVAPANSSVVIYNQVGQVMTNQVLKGTINVSSYPSGMYIVKVNNNLVTKFVK